LPVLGCFSLNNQWLICKLRVGTKGGHIPCRPPEKIVAGGRVMARCAYCGSLVLFGGVRDGGLRFCNQKCHQNGYGLLVAEKLPQDVVSKHAGEIHRGLCPKCHGNGPVDVYTSYRVYSLLVLTSWSSRPHVCCRSCGIKSQIGDAFFSLLFGWWGFPWGLIMTPTQIIRNFIGMAKAPDPLTPSDKLNRMTRLLLASQVRTQQ
jgi:hypothetical protein